MVRRGGIVEWDCAAKARFTEVVESRDSADREVIMRLIGRMSGAWSGFDVSLCNNTDASTSETGKATSGTTSDSLV